MLIKNAPMNFEGYGWLEWIDPDDYYAGPWDYVCHATGVDGIEYDIVRNLYDMECRYSHI
jgi:hypothetical protein